MTDRAVDSGVGRRTSRRSFLTRLTVWGGALAASLAGPARSPAADPPAPVDPTRELGHPVRPYGTRSRFETAVRVQARTPTTVASATFTPLQDSCGIVTPSALHFERHHAGVPDIDPARHRLLIHGLVRRPVILTLADLKRLPAVSRIHMIECSGNGLTEWAGRGAVRSVEVSTDGGRSWQAAELQAPVLRIAHTRFRLPWRWDGGDALLQSRCTDETGYVQPTLAELIAVRGLRSHYHLNAVQSWRVAPDGRVSNVHA